MTEGMDDSSNVLVTSLLDSENTTVLRAMLRSIPVVKFSYVERLSHCFSGCRSLPDPVDHLWEVPHPNNPRSTLFQHHVFLSEDSNLGEARDLITMAGGRLVDTFDALSLSPTPIFIVESIYSTPRYDGPRIDRVRVIDVGVIKQCIFQGNVSAIEAISDTSMGNAPSSTQPTSGGCSGWIGGMSHKSVAAQKCPMRPTVVHDTGGKKFRKRSSSSTPSAPPVPLQKWDERQKLVNQPKRIRRDDVDDWLMDCRNSQ
jgi:hypothetical protein